MVRIAYGQPSKDTICFPIEKAKTVLIAAEQAKVLKEQVGILTTRIEGLQVLITYWHDKDSVTTASYNQQLTVTKEQRALFEDQLKGYEKLLRKEKRKRIFTTIGGVITTGIVGYLYLSK